jgi:hypothetical protein
MRKSDIFSTLFLLLFSIYIAVASFKMGLGTLGKPASGFFPFCGAMLVGINAVVILIKAFSKMTPWGEVVDQRETTSGWKVACVLGVIVVFTLLVNTLGFALCTFLMFIFLLRVVMLQHWKKTIVVALSTTVGSYILFEVLLKANLPRGIFVF